MKNNLERFVQAIPYGRPLPKVKIKVNDKGEIIIYGKDKTWHVQDLNAAIRQQLFHVLFHYEDAILLKPIEMKYSGQISQMENTVQKIESLLKSMGTIQSIKVLKDKVTEFEKNLKDIEALLTEKEKRDVSIVKKVLIRAEKLLQERERCEKLITATLGHWIIVYSFLDTNKIKEVKWNQFFDSVRKIRTIYTNPYRARTQSSEVKYLQYKLYLLVKNDIEKAKKRLWRTIEKIVPIYPGELKIQINGEIMIIQDGKITTQGRG